MHVPSVRRDRRRFCRAVLALALALAVAGVGVVRGAEEAVPASPPPSVGPAPNSPAARVARVPLWLGLKSGAPTVPLEEVDPLLVRRAALELLDAALAPLDRQPICRTLLAQELGASEGLDRSALGAAWPPLWPVMGEGGSKLLHPNREPSAEEIATERETLEQAGLLRSEIALAGEWLRAVGARHSGPGGDDPQALAVRAARLEGVARLGSLMAVMKSTGLSARDLGASLLAIDSDRVSWPRELLERAATDPIRRALLRSWREDGLRWAAYHYTAGGLAQVMRELERPPTLLAELLQPGRARRSALERREEACSLGPRVAAALAEGDDDAAWIVDVVGDRISRNASGDLLIELEFERPEAAQRIAQRWIDEGRAVRIDGVVVTTLLAP